MLKACEAVDQWVTREDPLGRSSDLDCSILSPLHAWDSISFLSAWDSSGREAVSDSKGKDKFLKRKFCQISRYVGFVNIKHKDSHNRESFARQHRRVAYLTRKGIETVMHPLC